MNDITDIINRIAENRNLARVQRINPFSEPLNMESALRYMEALGKARSPQFCIDNENRWVYTQIIRWLYALPDMEACNPEAIQHKKILKVPGRLTAGLYIAGTTGTGKSWAMELLNCFADIDHPKIILGGEKREIHWASKRAADIWEEASTSDEGMSKYKTMPILCIQDLGSEPISEAVRMGTRREPLREILEARGDRSNLITLITSNHGICSPEIEKRYTDRVVSRLRGMCNFLVLNGKDRRTL